MITTIETHKQVFNIEHYVLKTIDVPFENGYLSVTINKSEIELTELQDGINLQDGYYLKD